MRHSDRPAGAVLVCLWCDHEFSPRKSGGSPQRFCCPEHRLSFHIAAHQFVLAEFSAGRLTVAEIKKFASASPLTLPADEQGRPQLLFRSGRSGQGMTTHVPSEE